MDIYNEETLGKKRGKHVLVLDTKEAQTLSLIVEAGVKSYPRKRSWAKYAQALFDKLDCWYPSDRVRDKRK